MEGSDIKQTTFVYRNIIENMNEGVLTLNLKGVITSFNPAAERILDLKKDDVEGKNYIEIFYGLAENDDFNQTVLDALYESSVTHNRVVSFYTEAKARKTLFITTSFLKSLDGGMAGRIGVIAVFNDITELLELRDAVRTMERIKKLNEQLEVRNQFISQLFGRYLSDEVVNTLIEKPGALNLGGEKKELTIIMTDLRGFTSFSERLGPETVVTMLNNYLGVMVEIISGYNGTVLEFIGDAIMVVFGAPAPLEDHAGRGLACAVAMQLGMEKINAWNTANGYPEIEMGIGINTGQVVVGNIGSEKRTKYGIVGGQVNLASRIESYTVGGQILISEATLEASGSPLRIKGQMTVHPKGVGAPITIYEIGGIGGSYNLYLPERSDELAAPAGEIPIHILLLEDKHLAGEMIKGTIIRLSLHRVEIMAEQDIPLLSNIKMQIPGGMNKVIDDIYAKIIKKDSGPVSFFTAAITFLSPEGKEFFKKYL